jgi:hypothetical protein
VQRLSAMAIWDGMGAALRGDLARLFAVAAPFTLLLAVAVELFGPPAPATLTAISGEQLLWRLVLPALLASIAQLAIIHLVIAPGRSPKEALTAAFAGFAPFIAAQLAGALPMAIGFLVLIIPGLYLFARLIFLAGPIIITERLGPLAALQRSWQLSHGAGIQLTLFVVLGLFSVIGIGLLGQGAGAALDVVARAAGADAVGRFLHALLPAVASSFVAIGSAAASAVAFMLLERR